MPLMRSVYLSILILGFMLLAFPQPLFHEPLSAQGRETPAENSEQVFLEVCRDFDMLASLLNDVTYVSGSAYPVLLKVKNHKSAIEYLSHGFEPELASALVNFYMAWDEDLNRMVVIPTDFMPLINQDDRSEAAIVFINEHRAVVQRLYENCYSANDSYMFTVTVQKEDSGWKISDLFLEEIKDESNGEAVNCNE